MTVSTARSTVADLVDSFAGAAPDRRDAEFQELAGALWADGALTDLALPAAPLLVALLDRVDDDRKGYVAIILGLLAEAEYPAEDGQVTAAIGEGVDRYLELWRRSPKGQPLSLALQYLLAHFPGHRDPILAAAAELDIDLDDRSRLDRALRRLDLSNPDLGRVFPSPSVWALDDSERRFDQAWISALTPEQIAVNWQHDTRTVLGHAGAKAYWAVRHGAPRPWASDSTPPRDSRPEDADVEIFARHAEEFRCPDCAGRLAFGPDGARCAECATTYPIAGGILNLMEGVQEGVDDAGNVSDFQFKLAEMPSMGFFYEAYARPNFLRLCGSNWGGAVTPADEDAYIAEHVRPVDGPVLDLAAGAGRWTEVLAGAVGADRVIALDLGAPMLTMLRGRLPEIPAVMASARTLPFGDASLGAVLCWNALQAFPQDAPAAIAEVGRCLRPGGTFTILTFQNSADPIYRHFVGSHHFPQHGGGLHLFELDDVKRWLAAAGLTVRDESLPGTFVLITAERTG